jgi:hypothetical protein
MPDKFQWLRLSKTDNTNAIIKHWTGPEGKKHIRSIKPLMAINQIQHILHSLPANGKMLEWGVGGSTLILLKYLTDQQHLTSIEHHPQWASRIKQYTTHLTHKHNLLCIQGQHIGTNATPLEENPAGLTDYIHPDFDLSNYDVFLVDGVARAACLAVVRCYAKPGAKVFLHDANRPWYDWGKKLYKDCATRTILADTGDYPPVLWEAQIGSMV